MSKSQNTETVQYIFTAYITKKKMALAFMQNSLAKKRFAFL